MVIQELIFKLKPKVILELALVMVECCCFISILRLMNLKKFNVIGVDIFIQKNRQFKKK